MIYWNICENNQNITSKNQSNITSKTLMKQIQMKFNETLEQKIFIKIKLLS